MIADCFILKRRREGGEGERNEVEKLLIGSPD